MTNPDETNGAVPDQTSTSVVQSQSKSPESPGSPGSIHDSLFYKLFSDPKRVAAELKCILPKDLVEVIEWSTLKIEPNRFVDPNLTNHFADIWLSVRVRRKKVAIHLLFEHSSGPKNHELLQALRYQVKFWEKEQKSANGEGFRPLTPILTVILHHSETGWRGRSRFGDYFGLDEELELLFRPYMVDFGVFVDDLSPLDADVLLSRPVPMDVQVMLFALRFGRSGPQLLQELPKVSPLLGKMMGDPMGRLAVHSFLVYIRYVGKVREDPLRMALDDVFVPVLHPEIAAIWSHLKPDWPKANSEANSEGLSRAKLPRSNGSSHFVLAPCPKLRWLDLKKRPWRTSKGSSCAYLPPRRLKKRWVWKRKRIAECSISIGPKLPRPLIIHYSSLD